MYIICQHVVSMLAHHVQAIVHQNLYGLQQYGLQLYACTYLFPDDSAAAKQSKVQIVRNEV